MDFKMLLLLTIIAVIGFGTLAAFGIPILLETLEGFDHLRKF